MYICVTKLTGFCFFWRIRINVRAPISGPGCNEVSRKVIANTTEECPELFSSDFFYRGLEGGQYFHEGQNCSKIFLPIGHNTSVGGTKHLIITKERLVLASVPYAPNESFFHEGQKFTILNFIRDIIRERAYASPDFIHQGPMSQFSIRLCITRIGFQYSDATNTIVLGIN